MHNLVYSVIVIIVYFICSHLLIEFLMRYLWNKVGKQRKAHALTATLGFIDRMVYALSFAIKAYGFIGLWLGIKIASRLVGFTEINEETKFQKEGERRNVYLIGNIISLILGLCGGILIKALFSSYVAGIINYLS